MKFFNRQNPPKLWIIVIIAAVLLVNLLVTNLIVYTSMKNIVTRSIIENELPLSNSLIYAEIKQELQPSMLAAKNLSNDHFIHKWLKDGNEDDDFIIHYLESIRDSSSGMTCFLVSEQSQTYYNMDGAYTISKENPEAQWYYQFISSNEMMSINIDVNVDMNNLPTVFINYKIIDDDGALLGVSGIGIALDSIPKTLSQYGDDYQRDIYFFDSDGMIVERSSGAEFTENNLADINELSSIGQKLLQRDPVIFEFDMDSEEHVLYSMHIPEFNWWVVSIQKQSDSLNAIESVLISTIIMHSIAILITLSLCYLVISVFQKNLKKMATTDSLTKLSNRSVFKDSLEKAIFKNKKYNESSCLLMIDIDKFKIINDTLGHLTGDHVLFEVAQIIGNSLSESDDISRWGGDEFMVIAYRCSLHQGILLADNIKKRVQSKRIADYPNQKPLTISIGVSEIRIDDTQDTLFQRADDAMYQAKAEGGNKAKASISL